jgi:hypothetical protein
LATTTKTLEDAGARISRFLFMQFVINLTFGAAVAIGLLILQMPYALVWGFFAAVLRYIPYLGPCVAAALPVLVSFVTSSGWTHPALVIALFVGLELVSNNVMEPVLYGQTVGMSEVAVILAAVFWAWMWGPVGLVLATPMTACLVVLGKHVPGLKIFDQLLGERPAVGDAVRLYQRLLARNDDDTEEVVQEFLKEHTLVETCDELLLPALELVHTDLTRGQIDDDDADWMRSTLNAVIVDLSAAGPGDSPEHDAAAEQEEPLVLGLPIRSEDEELALAALKQALGDIPCRFEAIAEERLLSERLAEISERGPVAVCISTFPPGDVAHVRQVCKRLRSQLADVRILVGRWCAGGASPKAEQLRAAGADHVVGSIGEMRGLIQSVVSVHRAARPSQGTAA